MRRGTEWLLRVLVIVHILVLVITVLLIVLLNLAFKKFVLVHFTEAHLRVVLVRVLIAVLHDLIIVTRRHTINLNDLHEHTSQFEFLTALKEKCVSLLHGFRTGLHRCLATAPGRLMHYATIVAALGGADSCTAVVSACIVIASIGLGAAIADISGGVSALGSILIVRNYGLNWRLLRRWVGKLHLLDNEPQFIHVGLRLINRVLLVLVLL